MENNLQIQPNDERPLAETLTYVQFCKSFTFQDNKWTRRKQNGNQIGRLYSVKGLPSFGFISKLFSMLTALEYAINVESFALTTASFIAPS